MKVIFSRLANADLEEIGLYIGRDNPKRSASFTRELYAACLSLAHLSLRAPLVPGLEHRGIRKRAHRGYLIFYSVIPDSLEIVRVLQGSREVMRHLTGDDL